jgi:hypothetical protein
MTVPTEACRILSNDLRALRVLRFRYPLDSATRARVDGNLSGVTLRWKPTACCG